MSIQKSPEVIKRQRIERRVVRAVIRDVLAAGYDVMIDNGGMPSEVLGPFSQEKKAIAEIMATDEERIYFVQRGQEIDKKANKWTYVGWVFMVDGNSGYDVICDFCGNEKTAELIARAEQVAEKADCENL